MPNSRANSLAAIRREVTAHVPVFDGTVWQSIYIGDNFRFTSWTDHWGVRWHADPGGLAPTAMTHPLADLADLDTYPWPDPGALPWTPDDRARLDAIDRTRVLFGGVHIKFIAERLTDLMGMESFLAAFYEEPDRLREVIARLADYTLACIERLLDLGVEIVHVSEDLGTQRAPLVSPPLVRAFLLPVYEHLFAAVHARGALVDFHSCGRVTELLPDLLTTGIDILNPVQVLANDQHLARTLCHGRVCVLGGIDSQVVMHGSPADVRADVHRAFAIWKPGGGWIAAPDQVTPGAPAPNLAALWETCWELAPY